MARGREALEADLNGDRYLALLDAIDELVADPDSVEDNPLRRARKALRTGRPAARPGYGRRRRRRAARGAQGVQAGPLRRGGVRGDGRQAAGKLIKALTDLQDVLGAHQDSVVAREILHELAGSARDSFPYGVLYAHQEQVGRNTFGDLQPAIHAAGKSKLRAWLD